MHDKPMLSLEQAQAAVGAMIADSNKDLNRRKVDVAVVDDAGNLLAYARMVRRLRPTFAIRKAYTSAGMDTLAFSEQLSSQNRSIESFGDPQLIANKEFGVPVVASIRDLCKPFLTPTSQKLVFEKDT